MANISVYVRMRPMLASQIESHQQPERRFNLSSNQKQISVEVTDRRQKIFNFNQVFGPKTTQQQLYNGLEISNLVNKVLDGYHSTIFAYGQTGSGKTYTIEGPSEDEGLMVRIFDNLFQELEKRNKNERVFKVILSFVQIYNEGIYDLIDITGKPLKMRWNKHQQFIVESLFEVQCRSKEDALKWWKKGQKNKIMGSHKMNINSSRSHCLLTMKVSSYDLEDPSNIIESKFQIVDLAGSERQKVTKSTGAVFKEGVEINKSLFSLRQVISTLYQISQGDNPNKHIPYRDSKLTSLLKQSIGGNTYCSMIACLNPTSNHFQQSLQTLTYASMASYISNVPSKNIDPKIRENQFLKQQNEQYRKQIKKLSDHIEQLTKIVEAGICASCQKNGGTFYEVNRTNKVESRISVIEEEQEGPTGIVKLPKFNNNRAYLEESTVLGEPNKNFDILSKSPKNQVPKTEKKTLKTTKDILESITMIKQLINANSGLREKIDILKQNQNKQQKQIYGLMKENQLLRDRWDMMNDAIGNDYLVEVEGNQAPIAAYERLLKQQKGSSFSRPSRMYSQNSSQPTVTKLTSYNQFLKKSSKLESIRARKKYHQSTINQNKRSSRTDSFSFN